MLVIVISLEQILVTVGGEYPSSCYVSVIIPHHIKQIQTGIACPRATATQMGIGTARGPTVGGLTKGFASEITTSNSCIMNSNLVTALCLFASIAVANENMLGSEDISKKADIEQLLKSCIKENFSIDALKVSGLWNQRIGIGKEVPVSTGTKQFAFSLDRRTRKWRCALDFPKHSPDGSAPPGIGPKETLSYFERISYEGSPLTIHWNGSDNKVSKITSFAKAVTDEPFDGLAPEDFEVAVPFGYIPQIGEISKVVTSLLFQAHSDVIDGIPVHVLVGKSPELELSLWLDPKCRYAVRKLVADRPHVPVDGIDIAKYVYSVKTLEEKDGRYFPMKYQVDMVCPGGKPQPPPPSKVQIPGLNEMPQTGPISSRRTVADVEMTKVEISPSWTEKDFAFQKTISNGTRVVMLDARHLNYVWVDGKVVPGLSAAALSAARNAQFSGVLPKKKRSSFVVVALTLLLVCLIAIFFWRWRFKNYEGGGT